MEYYSKRLYERKVKRDAKVEDKRPKATAPL